MISSMAKLFEILDGLVKLHEDGQDITEREKDFMQYFFLLGALAMFGYIDEIVRSKTDTQKIFDEVDKMQYDLSKIDVFGFNTVDKREFLKSLACHVCKHRSTCAMVQDGNGDCQARDIQDDIREQAGKNADQKKEENVRVSVASYETKADLVDLEKLWGLVEKDIIPKVFQDELYREFRIAFFMGSLSYHFAISQNDFNKELGAPLYDVLSKKLGECGMHLHIENLDKDRTTH